MNIKSFLTPFLAVGLLASSLTVQAADYIIDTKGMHASIKFKVSHLGYSWLHGRFNQFTGELSYDKNNPSNTQLNVSINTKSVDTNHAERDKHIRSDDFLDVDKFPKAAFVSTGFTADNQGNGILKGNFTLHGVTRALEITVSSIGEGKDPWGGYRIGFDGHAKITMADYGILKNLGPASKDVELTFSIEAIKKK